MQTSISKTFITERLRPGSRPQEMGKFGVTETSHWTPSCCDMQAAVWGC